MLRARPLADAPKDGTIVRLLVEWPTREQNPDGPWATLDDAVRSWTIGFNDEVNTGRDAWQFVGWNWNQDCFVDLMDRDADAAPDVKVIGWHKLTELSTEDPDDALRFDLEASYQVALDAVDAWVFQCDYNVQLFDACAEETPQGATALYHAAKNVRSMLEAVKGVEDA